MNTGTVPRKLGHLVTLLCPFCDFQSYMIGFPMCVCLVVVVELVSVNDSKSYAGCSFVTGRVSHAGQVKDEVPDKERHIDPPGLLEVGRRVDNPSL